METFKSMLRPAIGWGGLFIGVLFSLVIAVQVITTKTTLTDATPIMTILVTAFCIPTTTYFFSRTKEKLQDKAIEVSKAERTNNVANHSIADPPLNG